MTSDSTLSLAARLAANLFVDAIKFTKPGACAVAKVADHVLSLRPAKVDADLRAYLAMQAVGEADRLADAEAERESWEPGELSGLFPSGQPVDLPEEGVSQHPLYRDLQAQHEAATDDDADWPCGCITRRRNGKQCYVYMCDEHIYRCKGCGHPTFPIMQYDTACCANCTPVPAYNRPRRRREFNTMPNWSSRTPHTSAPGHRSEAPVEVDDSPESAPTPRGAGSGSTPEQLVGVGAETPGADGINAVQAVLREHYYHPADHSSVGQQGHCGCGGRPTGLRDWREHVAPLIIAALNPE